MKKLLCCLLAVTTLFGSVLTTVSCGGKGGGDNSSASAPIDESTVTLKFTKKVYNIENEQTAALAFEFTANGEEINPSLLTFESSDPTIATVDANGVVTGVSGGRAYITASYGSKTAKATINVTMKENTITVSDESCMLLVDGTKQVTANVKFGLTEIVDPTLTWVSSNPDVATVENGLITAVASGKAEITVTYENVSTKIAVTVVEAATQTNVNTFSEKYVNIYGRTYTTSGKLKLDHGASAVEVGFVGSSLSVTIYSNGASKMRVFVDGEETGTKMDVSVGEKTYEVASGLDDGLHVVRIVKASSEYFAQWGVCSFDADGFFALPENDGLKIEFIGSSTMVGSGVYGSPGQAVTMENSDSSRSFAYLTAHALNANYSVIAYNSIGVTIKWWAAEINMERLYEQVSKTNANSYAFDFEPDVIVVNLGSVESSYIQRPADGNPNYASDFKADYQRFLENVRKKNPNAYIICLYGTIHQNATVINGIRLSIQAMGDDKIVYNPFEIKENVDGAMNHPGSQAHKAWAEDLAAYIKTLI